MRSMGENADERSGVEPEPGSDPLERWRLRACLYCEYSLEGLGNRGTCPDCGRRFDRETIVVRGWSRPAAGSRAAALAWLVVWVLAMSVIAPSLATALMPESGCDRVMVLMGVVLFGGAGVAHVVKRIRQYRRGGDMRLVVRSKACVLEDGDGESSGVEFRWNVVIHSSRHEAGMVELRFAGRVIDAALEDQSLDRLMQFNRSIFIRADDNAAETLCAELLRRAPNWR